MRAELERERNRKWTDRTELKREKTSMVAGAEDVGAIGRTTLWIGMRCWVIECVMLAEGRGGEKTFGEGWKRRRGERGNDVHDELVLRQRQEGGESRSVAALQTTCKGGRTSGS
jgi:hypothetical protein